MSQHIAIESCLDGRARGMVVVEVVMMVMVEGGGEGSRYFATISEISSSSYSSLEEILD